MKTAIIILSLVFITSLAFGTFAYITFRNSEAILTAKADEFTEKGKNLSIPECIQEVLDWEKTCPAMQVLCDHYALKIWGNCFESKSRKEECSDLIKADPAVHTSRYGVAQCEPYRPSKRIVKICGQLHMASIDFCEKALSL